MVYGAMDRRWVVICYDCHRQDESSGEMLEREAVEIFKGLGWVQSSTIWKCPVCSNPPVSGIKHE